MTPTKSKTWLRPSRPRWREEEPRRLVFAPRAWLKFQYLCHAGPTEIAAFGLSAERDPLYLIDVLIVKQRTSAVTVAFDDEAVADLFDAMADAGVPPDRFARIWLHTHPGASVVPSGTDETTFARVFGACDWAVMAILGRTGNTSARLQFTAGPGGSIALPTAVDWEAWPNAAADLSAHVAAWEQEYATLVTSEQPMPALSLLGDPPSPPSAVALDLRDFASDAFYLNCYGELYAFE